MANYYGDAVATVGEYEDKDHKTKKRFLRVGAVFVSKNDQGEDRYSIKLDALPLGADWSGWLSVYPRKDKRQAEEDAYNAQVNQAKANQTATQAPVDECEPVDLSDIPF